MAWRIELTDEAVTHLKKIGHADAKHIRDYLRGRLQPLEDPRQLGKPLTGQLSELWRYRVGDYRLIASIEGIAHRSKVYR
ncbi:type II toxin-antitoxin system RelE/ParE family toxin [Vreelandella glaciei]|uniref:type II toxin-antitoxin system RelE family toxin n=1 Tax=Vreelandella glaciei TaxID=186761 RepID=UPI003001DDE9